MTVRVLTEVSGTVPAEREAELRDAYGKLLTAQRPDGLVRSELIRGDGGQWRIHTLWRDRDAFEAMRSRPEGPAAPALFQGLGVTPTVAIFDVQLGTEESG